MAKPRSISSRTFCHSWPLADSLFSLPHAPFVIKLSNRSHHAFLSTSPLPTTQLAYHLVLFLIWSPDAWPKPVAASAPTQYPRLISSWLHSSLYRIDWCTPESHSKAPVSILAYARIMRKHLDRACDATSFSIWCTALALSEFDTWLSSPLDVL